MKKHLFCLLVVSCQLMTPADAALLASDNASNYGGSFLTGSNQGVGFLPWSIGNNNNGTTLFAGSFIGDSTAGAGNVNSSGVSFGLFANPATAFVNADRGFSSTLDQGDVFTFQLAVNFDNGNKGFSMFAGAMGEVFNFNVGSGGSVSSANATLAAGSGAGYNYGGNDAVLGVAITATSPSSMSYRVSRTSSQGNQGDLFTGTVSGLTAGLSGFRFYASGTDGGAAQNNLYFNSLAVVPEPSCAALVVAGLALTGFRRRR